MKSKTIIARGIMERFEGGEYVKESNHILERLLTRFQITGLAVTNLFKGGPYLNLVSTSAYFQVNMLLDTTPHASQSHSCTHAHINYPQTTTGGC